jgi:5'-3' exonuclease
VSLLLAVDGDSFAHRAYHALPKSIRLNAVVGFTNMLVRLWQAEQPDSVLVAWDTLSTPTYRHEAFAPYQSGRVFEESILEQLEIARRSGPLASRGQAPATRRTTSRGCMSGRATPWWRPPTATRSSL